MNARDAHAQLTAARGAAYAWLRATLAALPAAVTSLSVGCVLEDHDDRPNLAPRLRASVLDGEYHYPIDQHMGTETSPVGSAMAALYHVNDDLRSHTAPFLFALGDEEWLAVTRADLAPAVGFYGAQPIAAADGPVLAAIMQEIADLPRGEATTILCHRNADGALTWNVTAP